MNGIPQSLLGIEPLSAQQVLHFLNLAKKKVGLGSLLKDAWTAWRSV